MGIYGIIALVLLGAGPYSVWEDIYDGGNTDMAHGIAMDSAGHIIIVGETEHSSDFDCWWIAHAKSGDSLWSKSYDKGQDEKGIGIAITRDGNVTIAINNNVSGDQGIRTILYDIDRNILWERDNNAGDNMEIGGIVTTDSNRIYVAGSYYRTSNYHLILLGYDEQGQTLVNEDMTSSLVSTTSITVDSANYIYVGESKISDCSIWKWSPEGDFQWWKSYNNNATNGFGLAINPANHLFQSGDVKTTPSNTDFLLLKWEPLEASANLLWPAHKAYDLGHNEYCRDIKLDEISDCYLVGWQVRGTEEDAALVKTDSAGAMLWAWVDTMSGNQEIEAIEVDEDGYIYLAGSHHNGTDWDMLVMQVRQPLTISGIVVDSFGARMSSVPITLSGDTTVEAVSDTDGYYSITVYNGGAYTVKPNLPGWAFTPSSYTYSPLAHREWSQDFLDGHWTGIGEQPVTEAVRLEVSASDISYTLPPDQQGTLTVFDPSGRIVERLQVQGSGQVRFPSTPSSGVYFVRLRVGNRHVTKKIVIS